MQKFENLGVFEILITQKPLKCPKDLFVRSELIYRILGERLLLSSLPGKALRTLVDIARLAKAEPCKLGIKRLKPSILFISLPIVLLFKLAIMKQFSIFVLIQCH